MTVPQPTWLTIAEAASLLGCSERSVRRNITKYRTRQVPTKCGGASEYAYEVCLDSLPDVAQLAWRTSGITQILTESPNQPTTSSREDLEDINHAYQLADKRTKSHFDKWSLILQKSAGVTGRKALGAWVEEWNRTQPEHLATSAASIYRVRDRIAKDGRISILLDAAQVVARSTVTDEWFEWFYSLYMDQSKLSVSQVRQMVRGRAIKEGGKPIADADFPSTHAFLRRLKREVAPTITTFHRLGKKKWNDAHGVSILRDYSDVPAGSCWITDAHTWDVFVKVPNKENPVTVYITLFIDMRTTLPMGWHVHTSSPSADNTLRAMRHGIDRFGLPDHVYADNGRENRNRDFSGITRGTQINFDEQATESLAARLGFQMHFAKPYNAQAKPIERQFAAYKNHFSRLFKAFKGGNTVEKPERLKAVVKSMKDIPDLTEFRAFVDDFLLNVWPAEISHGALLQGKSRAQAWNQLIQEREPMLRVSKETSSMLVTRTIKGSIRNNGIYLSALQCWYWANWMPVHKGRDITLRYDPEDLTQAWVYDSSLKLLGECRLREAVGALVAEGDTVGKDRLAAGIAERNKEIKSLLETAPKMTRREAGQMLDDLKHAYGPVEIHTGDGPIQLTDHDHDAAQLKREAGIGKADFSIFAKTGS